MIGIGFAEKWVEWIMLCVSTASYSVCLNGSEVGPIKTYKGLRQEDPISPYLFILCSEGLSSLLRQAEAHGVIHGRVCRIAPLLSHLFFVDDSFIFFNATAQEACLVKNILHQYEIALGQGSFVEANSWLEKQHVI